MPITNNISFQSPGYDYSADVTEIERRRALADALKQQAMQGQGTEVVNGWAVPQSGWGTLFSKIAEGAGAGYQAKTAEEKQRELSRKAQTDLANVLRSAASAGEGNPAPADSLGGGPARPSAAEIYMSHPMTAPLGMQLAQKENEARIRQRALAAIMGGGQQPQPANPMALGTPQSSVMAGSGPQTPPAQPPQAGNAFAGMPPQIVALMTSGDPELQKLGTSLLEASKGIAQRPGAPVVNPFTGQVIAQPTPTVPQGMGLNIGPNGPTAYQVPGFAAAQEGLNSIPNPSQGLIPIKTSSGQDLQLTQPEYLQWQRTGALPARYGGGQAAPGAPARPTGLPAVPGAVPRPAGGIGIPGMSQSQADQIEQERQKAGGKAVDEAFAKDYVQFSTGGAQDATKQLAQLKDVVGALRSPGANLTGPIKGNTPDRVLEFTNPQAIAMRERVEEVVQRSLRAILGAQFTEKEGERLIARAYNPRLSEAENAIRVDRLFTQLNQAYEQKAAAAKYFEKNGTLEGWKGKLPSMGDFDPEARVSSGRIVRPTSENDPLGIRR